MRLMETGFIFAKSDGAACGFDSAAAPRLVAAALREAGLKAGDTIAATLAGRADDAEAAGAQPVATAG